MPADAGTRAQEAQVPGLLPGDLGRIRSGLGRDANPTEIALFSVMWSEHCAYRHSRQLLASLPTRGPAVVQGPGENAGVLDLGDGLGLAMKVESHNHPSAVEPYQGAATGVGGILRDILALGARPVASLDGLGFGPRSDPHARWVASGVVAGVGDYGNAVGVPTVGGVTRVHAGFASNPLLNAMCVGLVPLDRLVLGRAGGAGELLVLLGATTGRDGVGGASFASVGLGSERARSRPQVQVGDPFAEKRLIEATLEAMAAGLVRGCQDMGAAGIVSSTTELCHRASLGCELDLERVPLRQPGMEGWEILLSESQERMLLSVRPADLAAVEALARHWSLEAVAIGRVVDEPVYRVRMHGDLLAELPLDLLCEAPAASLDSGRWPRREGATVAGDLLPFEVAPALMAIGAGPEAIDRRAIYRRYDHTVRARTALGPPSGAATLTLPGRADGVALTLDMNPEYGEADPYVAAELTVVEAVQNLAAVGARPLGLTDCLNLGDPTRPLGAAELAATVAGLGDAARALDVPVVGGNVSLYNEAGEARMPPCLAVGMAGHVAQVAARPVLGPDRPGQLLLLVGPLAGDLRGSAFARLRLGAQAGAPAAPDLAAARRAADLVRELRAHALARFAMDIWRGGLLAAAVRALLATGRGAQLDLPAEAQRDLAAVLFGEGAGRYLASVAPARLGPAEAAAARLGVSARVVGRVVRAGTLSLGVGGQSVCTIELGEVDKTWRQAGA